MYWMVEEKVVRVVGRVDDCCKVGEAMMRIAIVGI
jgi:hypothetical protein